MKIGKIIERKNGMEKICFLDDKGTFSVDKPENYSYLYFPVAGEKGIKSAVTPNLGGDIKLNQNAFITEPVSVENLHNNRSTRNFWCIVKDKGVWSATGQSAEAEAAKFTDMQDESNLVAGFMYHKMTRTSKKYGMRAVIESYVPLEHNVEIMQVEIENVGDEAITVTPVAAVPIYGRSADNIRDHRHVTSLLHRIRTTENGVYVRPTLSFDERGHQKNKLTYFVCGNTGDGKTPVSFYPTVDMYIGEGGSYTSPRCIFEKRDGVGAGLAFEGKEAVGGLRFEEITLNKDDKASYIVVIGAAENEDEIISAVKAYDTKEKADASRKKMEEYWQNEVNVHYHTGSKEFDNYMRWVSFQPFLRRIYGCSFLPYHDYGKGGRGWRDLWQDCLALLMMNPDGVREMIVDNYGGVRVDGSNATIIGEKRGEFIADRNNITRVWMDHGVWPLMTTKLYIEQTGDIELLNEKTTYFKDRQVERGTAKDDDWNDAYGNLQKDLNGTVYEGTILEHLLLQNICPFFEVGSHNHMRLRGADWNDALDMAEENGESVAFTCAYVGNLKQLAEYILMLSEKTKRKEIEIMEELLMLVDEDASIYDDIEKKTALLSKFVKSLAHSVSGRKVKIDAKKLADNLMKKAEWSEAHICKNEWVNDSEGNGWFNSYYDNSNRRVEGEFDGNVRMILTGQVFAIMSHIAGKEKTNSICNSAKKYLFDKKAGGYRINTNFKEEKYDMGRMFGFAYGEKENGAVFSHMTVMFANALYQNGFVKEGYEALKTLADTSLDFDTSCMYPGIPEYFNAVGRGMYSYLTGAASWYMLTVITEMFGVKGAMGDLRVEPKLVKEQFDSEGFAKIKLMFAGKKVEVILHNLEKKDYGQYKLQNADKTGAVVVKRKEIEAFVGDVYELHINLV